MLRSVAAAAASFGAEDVIDELVIAPNGAASAETDALIGNMGTLAAFLNRRVSEGEAGVKNGQLYLRGTYVSATAQGELEAKAAELGVEPAAIEIQPLPAATADCAAELETEINALVATTPIPFEPGGVDLSADAPALLDQVAALALKCGAAKIGVNGHTDADGSDAEQPDTEPASCRCRAHRPRRARRADRTTGCDRLRRNPTGRTE